MDQKILCELGDYLLARREEIIGEWLQAGGRAAVAVAERGYPDGSSQRGTGSQFDR